ncbi:MAG: M48 family metalloprotease [Candidatus Thiodiazotropha sp. (ex Monitilora ramsayi)]|nr:M48 family metalloprotease [Candidatus Thiodiazotropha sp. (ex Monitilora ramsayi)]
MSAYLQHKIRNTLQSLLMIAAIAGLCGTIAWLIGGPSLAVYSMVIIILIYRLNPAASPELAMRLFRAQPLSEHEAPMLIELAEALGRKVGLEQPPQLYYLPSDVMNAFTVGTRNEAAIALSDGLLRRLEWRELSGVMAHEMMHIVNQDTRLMAFADLAGRLTGFLSITGQLLLLINLPLMILGQTTLPWLPILLLLLAPTLSTLVQLALSRSREYEADLGAVELTGDPLGLASALSKLETPRHGLLERIFHPGPRIPDPSILRSHPPTNERVQRLLEIARDRFPGQVDPAIVGFDLSHLLANQPYKPRWHRNGMWY